MQKSMNIILSLAKKEIIVFIAGMLLFTLGLVSYYKTNAINSDDVAQKAIISQLALPVEVWVPADHFLLKAPINIVVDAFVHSPTKNIFISSWFMNLISLSLFFLTVRYFLNKYADYKKLSTGFYLAFLYMCVMGGGFMASLASPQYRNLEIGIAFGFLWFIDKYILLMATTKITLKRLALPLFGATMFGLFIYSDPAFFVYLAGPLAFTTAVYCLREQKYRTFMLPVAFLFAGLVFFGLFNKLFVIFGFHTYSVSAAFVPWDRFGSNLLSVFQSVLFLQNAHFFGLPVVAMSSMVVLLNAFLLSLVLIAFPLSLFRQKKYWITFMAIQPVFLLLAFVFSSAVYPNTTSVRYLVLLPFYGVVLTALAVERLTNSVKFVIYLLLSVAIIGNTVIITKNVAYIRHDHPNEYNQKIARLIKDKELEKGYAPYWNAGITGFWTDFKTDVFPVTYSKNPNEISPYYININVVAMQKMANRSFIIVSNYPGILPETQTEFQAQYSTQEIFRAESARKQFGEPVEVLSVTQFTSIYIYNYDLLSKMKPRVDYTDAQQ